MSYNAGCETSLTETAKRYGELAALIGLETASVRQSAINLIRTVRQFEKHMGVPHTIKEAGVDEAKFREILEPMAEAAMARPLHGDYSEKAHQRRRYPPV